MEAKTAKRINIEFALLLLGAFLLSYIPILRIPFTWIMTFFHEISHGLAALITGGSVEKIMLHLSGSGLCYTTGGIRFIVLISGYIGAVLWGILVYLMADALNHKHTSWMAGCIAGLIALTGLFYGRDIITLVILLLLLALFLSVITLQHTKIVRLFLKFVGLYVVLDAIKAPIGLIDGRHYGDGALLADLTGIPELLWVLLWLGSGVIAALGLWKVSFREESQ